MLNYPFLFYIVFVTLFFPSCNQREKKMKQENLKAEYIFRRAEDVLFIPEAPLPNEPMSYSWQDRYDDTLPKITKDFFRCKGDPLNPVITQKREGKEALYYRDCIGSDRHSLPLKNDKEFIYPCLIEILNYLQQKTHKRVVITSGHRCPQHNSYCDFSPANWSSKHMIGAEVSFFIEGMENDPNAIVELIQLYYKENFNNLASFSRYEQGSLTTRPWFNKEIFIKLYLPHEGRNCDNRHSHPYLSIQVRWDRELNTSIQFDSKQAQNYLRN